jgi:iron complex outermembrane receptor protein
LAAAAGGASEALAQAAPNQGPTTLQEIIVTAQKREQNLQSVPISVTAVTAKTLEANRITNVMNLNAVAPNLTVRPSVGGVGIPTFSLRGVVSYGSVPGSDKSISLYIDGVYIGAATGSAFELPDVDRIEVLKGPQGTLFGRNATAGAVNIITRDPPGRFQVRQDFTVGNYDQFKSRTRIDFGTWHDLTGSINFVHDERQGDIKNTGAGTVWDYSASPKAHEGILTSPKHLGDKNANLIFASFKYKPTDALTITDKFDWSENHYTPEGVGLIGMNLNSLTSTYGALFTGAVGAILAGNSPSLLQIYPTRPKALNNSFSAPAYDNAFGDSLIVQYRVNDQLSLKNIAAYRYSYIWADYQLDGLGGLTIPSSSFFGFPLSAIVGQPVGTPFEMLTDSSQSIAKQYSDEFQANYDSKYVTATVGALYFQLSTRAGGPFGLPNNYGPAACIPGGKANLTVSLLCSSPSGYSLNLNRAKSYAGYIQVEGHLTSQLDIVGGYRLTKDEKSGSAATLGFYSTFSYEKTKPSYSIGLNYKPWENILLYAKYANAFVSGGNVASVAFLPETAHSYEGGIKADLLERRLRTNIAIWDVTYQNLQQATTGIFVGKPQIGTVVVDEGNAHARGFELEVTALPMHGLTLNGGLGYTDFSYTQVTQPFGGSLLESTVRPKWTANVSAEYDTDPLFDDVRLSLRTDANYRSRENLNGYSQFNPTYVNGSPAVWLLNARVALDHIKLAGSDVSVALWVQNLTDDKSPLYAVYIPLNPIASPAAPFAPFTDTLASTNYQPARTFGLDISFTY